MQIAIGNPTETPWIHATCDAALGLTLVAAAVGLATRVRVAADSAQLVACTALFGLGIPAVVVLAAGTLGGIPHNASATLAFLFPLGMMTALVQDDRALFRDDSAYLRNDPTFLRNDSTFLRNDSTFLRNDSAFPQNEATYDASDVARSAGSL